MAAKTEQSVWDLHIHFHRQQIKDSGDNRAEEKNAQTGQLERTVGIV